MVCKRKLPVNKNDQQKYQQYSEKSTAVKTKEDDLNRPKNKPRKYEKTGITKIYEEIVENETYELQEDKC